LSPSRVNPITMTCLGSACLHGDAIKPTFNQRQFDGQTRGEQLNA
jgi:hypothetical protein